MRPEFHDAVNFVPESVERAPVVGASSSRVSLLLCIAFPAAITVTTDCVAHHATIIELSTERYRRRGALGNRARDHAGPPAEIENHDVNEEPLPWAAEQATAQLPVPSPHRATHRLFGFRQKIPHRTERTYIEREIACGILCGVKALCIPRLIRKGRQTPLEPSDKPEAERSFRKMSYGRTDDILSLVFAMQGSATGI